MLDADDLLSLVYRNRVPNGHTVGGQMQLVGAGQRIIDRKRVREGRDRLI